MRQADNECDIQCNLLWDGFGRWVAGYTWKPYINSTRNGIPLLRISRENGCSDFWDCLGGLTLVMIVKWYSRQLLTNHK